MPSSKITVLSLAFLGWVGETDLFSECIVIYTIGGLSIIINVDGLRIW